MRKADPIIRTKLHPPFLRPALVARPRLAEPMAEGLRRPLTLVAAPAGFGKTTLIASSIAACAMPAAWLSLDQDDNQADRFLTHLVASLQDAEQRIGGTAQQLLSAAGRPPATAVLTSLINDLDAAGQTMALVLDDYQFIRSQEVHDQVIFLLEHCPVTLHLVIATRSDPPLPLARLRARDQLVEVRAADLRFTSSETAQFLNEVMDLDLDAQTIALLEERTEGWIAGLQMAALSLRDSLDLARFLAGFAGTNRYILDYLLEEVLSGQPPKVQQFLLHTSILERLTAPLCEYLLDMKDISRGEAPASPVPEAPALRQPTAVLEYLDRANLFLVPLDDKRTWYRYHHLFADMLRARLAHARPDLVPHLHARAAAWLEQNGEVTEAIGHLFTAGEIGRAADLIERYGPAHLGASDPSVMWMADRLPAEAILARPKIGLYQAWLLIIRGHIEEARPLLNDLSQQLTGAGPGSRPQWVQTFASLALAFLSPPGDAADLEPLPGYEMLRAIPAEEPLLRNAADYLYGMALGRRGDLDRAAQVAEQSVNRVRKQPGNEDIPTLAPFLSRVYLIQGRLHAAAALCREFIDSSSKLDKPRLYTAGSMMVDLGEVLYEWNFLREAEQYVRDGLRANELWHNIMTDGFGLAALTRILQARGEYGAAMQVLNRFEERMSAHSRPREFDEALYTLRVRLQLAAGDLQNPARWADQVQAEGRLGGQMDKYRLTLAHIRLAQGRHAEVEELLAGSEPPAAGRSRISRRLESELLLAAAVAGQGRRTQALAMLESSLNTAEPEGYMHPFLDVGKPVHDLLAAYLQSGAAHHRRYAQKLLESFELLDRVEAPPAADGGLVEPLSPRELEVLQLITQGMTNKAIAGQLVISPGTVKAHTASIYRKLDVANRTEAAARARQLNILS